MGDGPKKRANMCFSAEADFVSGALIGAIGVATLSQVEKPREIPLAALPAAFALHQFTEGFVWRDLDAGATHATGPAVYGYLLFAWILLPVLVPVAIMLLEPPGRTRRRIGVFVGIGAVAAAYLSASLLAGDISAHAAGHTVLYGGVGRYADAATALNLRRAAPLEPPARARVRGRERRRGRRDRNRAGQRSHVDLVFVGRDRQHPHLLPTGRVAERRP